MVAFIKRRTDFKTIASGNVSSWELPLASVSYDTGKVVVTGLSGRGNAGDFLLLEGKLWLIDTVTPEGGKTTFKLSDVRLAFDRSLPYTQPTTISVSEWIASELTTQFTRQQDPRYAMPYLHILNAASSPWYAPAVDDNGLYSLPEYLQTVEQLFNIRLRFTVSGDTLLCDIRRDTRPTHQVLFTDGQTQLKAEAYSRESVAKITTLQNGTTTHWYLASDGSISNSIPASRAVGEWKTLVLKENDIALDKVTEQFARNKYSHKIEFMSNRSYALYDNLLIRMEDGTVVRSYVTYVGSSSSDSRFHYKSGELTTTLTDTMKGVLKNERNTGNHLR